MSKTKLSIVVLFFILASSFKSNAQVFEKGDVLVDLYAGGPNLTKSIFKSLYDDYTVDGGSITTSGFGPVGAKAEYLLGKRIGIGLNFNYSVFSGKGNIVESADGKTYDFKSSSPRFRAMGTFNIHMGKSKRFDKYFSFGIGYGSFSYKETTQDPYLLPSYTTPIPVAIRTEFGMRYFVTDNIGLAVQVGLGGGPLIGGGLAFKF